MAMRKSVVIFLSFVLTAFLTFGCSNGQLNSSKDVIELDLNTYSGSTHFVTTDILEPWVKRVEEETGGKVKVNLFLGGTLGSSATVLQDIKAGAYDVGLLAPIFFGDTEVFPMTIATLPFAMTDINDAVKVMTKFSEKYEDKIWSTVKLMGMGGGDVQLMYTSKPLSSFNDIDNLNVFSANRDTANLVKSWGAVPVALTWAEAYESMQKGVINAIFYASAGAEQTKLYEVAPYIIDLKLNISMLIPIMSKDFYNELPDDLQKIFDEKLNPALADSILEVYYAHSQKSIDGYVKASGNEMLVFSPGDKAKILAPAEQVWNDWVKEANEKGYPGDEMMSYFKELLNEEGIELPF